VALPTDEEERAPSFEHHASGAIPLVQRDGARLRIVVGSAYGVSSPVRVLSPTFYVDAQLATGSALPLPDEHQQRAAYVAEGEVGCEGRSFKAGQMIVFHPGRSATLRAQAASRVMLLGGAPVGERHIWWNFVSSSKARIERAKADWKEGRFGKVVGDEQEFIPLPEA
jgi:redox-sensitive bicupin YhaK (pirin superfamily)